MTDMLFVLIQNKIVLTTIDNISRW